MFDIMSDVTILKLSDSTIFSPFLYQLNLIGAVPDSIPQFRIKPCPDF